MSFFTELGLIGLFISAFLAATVLPLSSEVVLSALYLNDFNPWWLLLVATLGNVLGSVVNYLAGYYGSDYFIKKLLKTPPEVFEKSRQRFQKWGLVSLLFAWVPVIGDPLTLIAGVLRVNFMAFVILVSLGKALRYALLLFGVSYI